METNYQASVGAGEIITGGAGCEKTWELRRRVLASKNLLLLSFTNKDVQNAKEKIKMNAGHSTLYSSKRTLGGSSSCATNRCSSKSLVWCQTNGL